ncbi:MAG: DEAD/DEAH box helicase family protein, partial [bacterium]
MRTEKGAFKPKLILQSIADDIRYDDLPPIWREVNLNTFSKTKSLYDFQENALKNALKILHEYYGKIHDYHPNENLQINFKRKSHLLNLYQADPSFPQNALDYDLSKRERKSTNLLQEGYYPIEDNKVEFLHFINRMAFWMATGAGKTLVIVKLIEILKHLIQNSEIPPNDILFLTYREDLLEQFKNFVEEFNSSNPHIYINLKSLKEYDSVKRGVGSLFKDREIIVFYYRSDLISDEQKEKLVDFRNYDNEGRWFILLDEAHKGDKEESKRQIIYSILSRNGFLFNFSATFTDPSDFLTTVFNFNLDRFISEGYGKRLYLSQEEIRAFRQEQDFSEREKRKIVLKSLILLSYIRKFLEEIRAGGNELYHKPLLLVLVNSVNVEEADLKLFFRELEKIGEGKFSEEIFEEAKRELIEGFERERELLIPDGDVFELEKDRMENLRFQDILSDVFNSPSPGNIEVLLHPKNRQEMAFKLRTSDRPFALVKIGDISGWLKRELEGYEISERFEGESFFEELNSEESDINILMGSRTFYEGWDSNRPNIVLFINIGVGTDAKKFVLQSVGRGVRIEPIKDKRLRLLNLYRSGMIKDELFKRIKDLVAPIETLFVFGTNPSAIRETANILKEEKQDLSLERYFTINEEVQELPLYIPVYKKSLFTLADTRGPQKFPISEDDLELARDYLAFLEDDRVFLMQNDNCDVKTLKAIKESFKKVSDFYRVNGEGSLGNPFLILSRIVKHFSLIPEELERFKKLEEEIIHFKRIRFLGREKLDEFLKNLEKVRSYKEKERELRNSQLSLEFQEEILEGFRERRFDGIRIKYVPRHYYLPIVLSERDKVEYLNHIIQVRSEVEFIEGLERYLGKKGNLFERFDWWAFSKIDERTDGVFIPWYNPKSHSLEHYHPDFIFWLRRGRDYYIVFIDPKGMEHTDYQHRVDWYRRLYEGKVFEGREYGLEDYRIRVYLFLATRDIHLLPDGYKEYWFDDIERAMEKILG